MLWIGILMIIESQKNIGLYDECKVKVTLIIPSARNFDTDKGRGNVIQYERVIPTSINMKQIEWKDDSIKGEIYTNSKKSVFFQVFILKDGRFIRYSPVFMAKPKSSILDFTIPFSPKKGAHLYILNIKEGRDFVNIMRRMNYED